MPLKQVSCERPSLSHFGLRVLRTGTPAGTTCFVKQAKMRSIDAQKKSHADRQADRGEEEQEEEDDDEEEPTSPAIDGLGRDGRSGVPQVTEVSTLVASFCKSMERYTVRDTSPQATYRRRRLGYGDW